MLPFGIEKRRGDNGIGNIGGANTAVILTLAWCFLSISLVIFGFWHCRASSFNDFFICNEIECRLVVGGGSENTFLMHRNDLTHVEIVRVDSGNKVVNWYHLEPKQVNQLGHNIEIKFMHSSDPGNKYQIQRHALLSHRDMSRVRVKFAYNQIFDYMQRKTDKVDVRNESMLSVIGVISICLGAISLVLSCLIGQWSDPTPRRLKKQY